MGSHCQLLCIVTTTLLGTPDPVAVAPGQIELAPPRVLSLAPAVVSESDPELRKLLKQRYNATIAELKDVYRLYVDGRGSVKDMTQCVEAFAFAGSECAETPVARVSEFELALSIAKYVETMTVAKQVQQLEPRHAVHHARACRLGIEIQLVRARQSAKAVENPTQSAVEKKSESPAKE
jgi:hypothetical protein